MTGVPASVLTTREVRAVVPNLLDRIVLRKALISGVVAYFDGPYYRKLSRITPSSRPLLAPFLLSVLSKSSCCPSQKFLLRKTVFSVTDHPSMQCAWDGTFFSFATFSTVFFGYAGV